MKPKPLHSFYGTVSTLLPFTVLRECKKKKNGMQEREKSMDRDICHFLMPFSRGRVNRSMFLFFRKQWTEMTSREVAQI
jgi:hypothetical protein